MKEIKQKKKSYIVNKKNNKNKSKRLKIQLQQINKKKANILLIWNNIKIKLVKFKMIVLIKI